MAVTKHFWFSTALLVTLLFGAFAGSIIIQALQRAPAVEVLELYDAGDIAAHDGRIFIYTKILRTRICQTERSSFLYTLVDHGGVKVPSVVPLEPDSAVQYNDIGTTSFILSYKLPAGLWPAEWQFVTKSVDYCSPFDWFAPHRRESVPLVVDIERARAANNVPVTAAISGGGTKVRGRSPLQ
jgi:hypothetical protein